MIHNRPYFWTSSLRQIAPGLATLALLCGGGIGHRAHAVCASPTQAEKECAKAIQQAKDENTAVGAVSTVQANGVGNNVNAGANLMTGASNAAVTNATAAQGVCNQDLPKCETECTGTDAVSIKNRMQCRAEIKTNLTSLDLQIAKATADAAAASDTALKSSSTGFKLGDTINKALPYVAAGLALAASAGVFKKKDTSSDQAILPSGGLDCSKSDAGLYSDCDSILLPACTSQIGSAMSANCTSFTSRYCSDNVGSAGVQEISTAGGGKANILIGASGAGKTSDYCVNTKAVSYCQDSTTATCPACLQLQASQSTVCKTNPATCMAQNSGIQLAAMAASCTGDPLIANYLEQNGGVFPPAVYAGTSDKSTPGAGVAFTGPAPVLTSSATETLASAPGAAGGINVSSVSSGRKLSSVNAGPSSDIQGQFGPNLLAMTSQTVRTLCKNHRVNNCP